MKVAVVGGGIFGCTIAIDLAKAGASVTVLERRSDILSGSCARNQARLHGGYHYPRSDATAQAARADTAAFVARFPNTIHRSQHWYILAPGSKVQVCEYIDFMKRNKLPFNRAALDKDEVPPGHAVLVAPHEIHTANAVFKVYEGFIDVDVLRRLLRRQLAEHKVTVRTNYWTSLDSEPGYDFTVWATYGVPWPAPLRYEVCETAVLELGRYRDDSFVVIDGDFCCLDPRGKLYSLYDVKHSVHYASEGLEPVVPPEYQALINRSGVIRSPLTHFDQMVDSASRFLWGLQPDSGHVSIYHGSMWSLRAVLPTVDNTDARPTIVKRDGNVLRVLSGKMNAAATVGKTVVAELLGAPA